MDALSLDPRRTAFDSDRVVALWRAVFTRTVGDAPGQFPDSVVPAGMNGSKGVGTTTIAEGARHEDRIFGKLARPRGLEPLTF